MSGISPASIAPDAPLILVADDDRTTRLLLRSAMEQEGYRVIEVTNGQQCLHAFTHHKPDLILLDAMMPVMDGFTCCQQLVQLATHNRSLLLPVCSTELPADDYSSSLVAEYTPILMITALDDPESVDRAFDAGASDYITKPIHWAVLRQRVRRLLQQAQMYKQLEAANRALQQLANVDGLTGLANRRRFDEYLTSQWLTLAKEGSPLSLILCDIDYFKFYNDNYGHPAGDTTLQKVGRVLNHAARKTGDLVARYGGEEFAVIMPHTDAAGAVHVAQTIQTGVRGLRVHHACSDVSQYVTLSLGVATTIPIWELSPGTLIWSADKALYQAKAEGRDRMIFKQLHC
jgi:diguanylate cyclase (GGDEF)-like protein